MWAKTVRKRKIICKLTCWCTGFVYKDPFGLNLIIFSKVLHILTIEKWFSCLKMPTKNPLNKIQGGLYWFCVSNWNQTKSVGFGIISGLWATHRLLFPLLLWCDHSAPECGRPIGHACPEQQPSRHWSNRPIFLWPRLCHFLFVCYGWTRSFIKLFLIWLVLVFG